MNYQETIDYLFSQLPVYQNVGGSAYKEGLDNSLALDKYFDSPHTTNKTIHVAGTNGKGSTSHLLAAILQMAGYKVGLYTSPHLVDFRERIKVNGKMIREEYIVDFVAKHRTNFEPIQASFFELTMTMAFQYFSEEQVDVAIIEVGLGGRLDSTNIIRPDLCVITNISLDHTQFLGDTLEKIAKEKAGIMKKGIPVVIGESTGAVKDVFVTEASIVDCPILFADEQKQIMSYSKFGDAWAFETKEEGNIVCELGGTYQLKNADTVLNAIHILKSIGYKISQKAVAEGFSKVCQLTGLMGRWHVLQEKPKVVCDTGHNEAGIAYLVQQLSKEKFQHLHIVIGMVNDKDITKVLALLPKENVSYYFTQASIARALNANELKQKASDAGLCGSSYMSVAEAVRTALQMAQPNDLVFVGGSNFVVGEALPLFSLK